LSSWAPHRSNPAAPVVQLRFQGSAAVQAHSGTDPSPPGSKVTSIGVLAQGPLPPLRQLVPRTLCTASCQIVIGPAHGKGCRAQLAALECSANRSALAFDRMKPGGASPANKPPQRRRLQPTLQLPRRSIRVGPQRRATPAHAAPGRSRSGKAKAQAKQEAQPGSDHGCHGRMLFTRSGSEAPPVSMC